MRPILHFILGLLVSIRQQDAHLFTRLTLMENRIMAQIDDLNTALDSVSAKLDTLKTDVDSVLAELREENQNPAVDLTSVIAKVQAISGKLDTVTAEFPSAPVTTEPSEPTTGTGTDGGGDTTAPTTSTPTALDPGANL